MSNNNINITPLTKDEQNRLHGGFGIIRINTTPSLNNTNQNCDQTLTSGDTNINCKGCSCGNGGPVQINMKCGIIDKPINLTCQMG